MSECNLSLESFRQLIETSPLAVVGVDRAHRVVFWNVSAERLFGWTEQEVRGKSLPMVPGREVEYWRQQIEALFQGADLPPDEGEVRRRDGSRGHVAIYTSMLRDASGEPSAVFGFFSDISQLRERQDLISIAEYRFRALIAQSSDAYVLLSPEAIRLGGSASTSRVLGYSLEEFVGRNAFDDMHPDDAPEVFEVFQELLQAPGAIRTTTCRYRHRNGSWLWVECIGQNLLHDPAIGAIVVNYRDVTAQKEAQDALRESEARLRLLLEQAPAILWTTDRNLVYTSNSGAGLRSLGAEAGSAVGKSLIETVRELGQNEIPLTAHLTALSGEPAGFDSVYHGVALHSYVQPFRDSNGEIIGTIGVALNVSEKVAILEALRRSEERWRNQFKRLPLPTFVWRWDGSDFRLTDYNDLAEKVTQGGVTERVGVTSGDLFPDRPDIFSDLQRCLEERSVIQRETWVTLPTTDETLLTELTFVFSPPDLVVAHLRDVTDRREREQSIAKMNEELEQLVQIRTAELQASINELESFTYAVAHDLRQPLRTINGMSSILYDDHASVLDGEALECLSRLKAACRRMGRLIDELLKLSRVSRMELRFESVDIGSLARALLSELQAAEPDRRMEAQVDPLPSAFGDRQLIELLLQNLISNAWKFTRRSPAPRIEVGYDSGRQSYYVRDNGAGFDMRFVHRLFKPFERLHTDREFEGTGVGLATVYRIVARHGGHVEAESVENEGACFFFSLGDSTSPTAGESVSVAG